ncbi:uncharacterized protein N7483_008154 [Penicillium malachiteum]|uniref:uncharacterized protein n=1 Tax=Penicillium malachiteum TaxID=1324776 RepID=UPI002546DE59|nr:uncharacterized protein N7483_008154 [Penicillium malachiteum]KAJ5720220.1 hypothetical protein N7483_008154 [Penicillium malachiteum]
MGILGDRQELYFSTEHDEWEISYQPRLGLPLTSYKEKWEALKQISPSSTAPMEQGLLGTASRPLRRLQYLAEEYLTSSPGLDSSSANIALLGGLRSALDGKSLTKEKTFQLTETTVHRLGAMHEAEYLRQQVRIYY